MTAAAAAAASLERDGVVVGGQQQDSNHRSRSYWRCSKGDFYPEPTFQSLQTYKSSFLTTLPRLYDRLISGRSTDTIELIQLRKQSENPMKPCLTWWDLIWLGFGSVVGSGIFSITGQEARNHAGPSITLSYALSGFSALLSAFCYAEFAVEIPVAGGSFSFLRIELGDLVAFIAAGNILLEAVVGSAGLSRSWSSYLASMVSSRNPDFFRFKINSFSDGFNQLDPLAAGVLIVVNLIAMAGTKGASYLNWVSSVLNSGVIVFIIVIGFIHTEKSNLIPFFPFGVEGTFRAAAIVYWSYVGFDMVATMAEETKKPGRDIPLGLVGSMSAITIIYCLMSLCLTGMQKYTEIDRSAAYSVVFESIKGLKWASYLVSACALQGITTSLLVGSLGQARYMTQIARAHMIPPWFALIHPVTGTPINATVLITLMSSVVAFFSSLEVLSSVLSFSTLFIFTLMAVALLVRRYYVTGATSRRSLWMFVGCVCVVAVSSVVVSVLWNSGYDDGWVLYVVFGLGWLIGTTGLQILPQMRKPRVWGVPLVPWLPCVSIAMNSFLIGSLGYRAFVRFFVCSGVMLVYYLMIGLHATYDFAHQDDQNDNDNDVDGSKNKVEDIDDATVTN